MTGYPSDLSSLDNKEEILISEKISNKTFDSPAINFNYFTDFKDLNNDGKLELLYASYEWKDGEGHFSPHFWDLSVYELQDNKYQIAKWWNDGKSYTTSKKIQSFDNSMTLLTDFQNKIKITQ